MHLLPLLILGQPAFASDILFQGDVRGGVAVDASAIDVSILTGGVMAEGPPFQLLLPVTAAITDAFLILHAEAGGFAATADVVHLNGIDLSFGSLISASETTEVYAIPSLYFTPAKPP